MISFVDCLYEMDLYIRERLSGIASPVSQQPRLEVFLLQRLLE
jgi:hypothetical protein